jgi:hypothetical protein
MAYFRPLVSKADKFVRLSWQERSLLIQALVLLQFVALSFHLLGMGQTQYARAKLSPEADLLSSQPQWLQVEAKARMVAIAAHYSQFWDNCPI